MPDQDRQTHSESNQDLVEELLRFSTFEELSASSFFKEHQQDLRALLLEPRVIRFSSVSPRLRSFVRVVEWNIERGSRLDAIADVLNNHEVLRYADVLLINEIDEGMVRSGDINVPLELSRAISAHAIVGFEYLELTKGTLNERRLPGQNTAALHGNAILSRYQFANPAVFRLPRCENSFESIERRLGGRIGITVELELASQRVLIGTTHLDVVNTPRCRGRQMQRFLENIDSRCGKLPVLIGGDLNSHTFSRGTRLRAMRNTVSILIGSRQRLRRRLKHPEVREPSIRLLSESGFDVVGFNDRRPTSRSIVSNLDDSTGLPQPMKWWVNRRVGPEGILLEFRLDWLAARGLRPLKAREAVDSETGTASIDPQTIRGLQREGHALSDHDPIVVDITPDL